MSFLFQSTNKNEQTIARVALHPWNDGETEYTRVVKAIEAVLITSNKYVLTLTKMIDMLSAKRQREKQDMHRLEVALREAKVENEKLNPLFSRLLIIPKDHLADSEKSLRKQREAKLRKECKNVELSLEQVTKDVHRILRQDSQLTNVVSETEDDDEEEDDSYSNRGQLCQKAQEEISNEIDHLTQISKDRLITVHSIERQTREIQEAMKDLHDMVHKQKPLLESIETRIDVTLNDVKAGVDEMQKAEKLQIKKKKEALLYRVVINDRLSDICSIYCGNASHLIFVVLLGRQGTYLFDLLIY